MIEMVKIVYNECHGGFGLSDEALKLFCSLKGIKVPKYGVDEDVKRNDPILVKVVETLGKKANGHCARLAIREIPKGSKYRISEYDGAESVMMIDEYEWSIA